MKKSILFTLFVVLFTSFLAKAEDKFAVELRFPFSSPAESPEPKCGHDATFLDLKASNKSKAIAEGESLLKTNFNGNIKCCYKRDENNIYKCADERIKKNPKIIGVDILKVISQGSDGSASYAPICRLGASLTSIEDCK